MRDLIATLLKEVSHDVTIEPALMNASQEAYDLPTSSVDGAEARADVSVRGFWLRYQRAFFDVKVCNLTAPSYREKSTSATLLSMEKQKKRCYNHRIQSVDKGTFTPSVFGATGGVARECSIFLSKLAEKLSLKQKCSKTEMIMGIITHISHSPNINASHRA